MYKPRLCVECGAPFQPRGSRSTACSLLCRVMHGLDRSRGPEACWEWRGAKISTGYGAVGLGGGKIALAHRVVMDAPAEVYVLHRCDNPPCCNPSHLFLGTAADNVRDMWLKGRQQNYLNHSKGDNHYRRRRRLEREAATRLQEMQNG